MSLSHALLRAVSQPSTGAGTPYFTRDQADYEKSREAACPPNFPTLLASAHPIPSAPPSELPYPSPQLNRNSLPCSTRNHTDWESPGRLPAHTTLLSLSFPSYHYPPPSYHLAPASSWAGDPPLYQSPSRLEVQACSPPAKLCHSLTALASSQPYLQSCALLIVLPQAQSGVETPCSPRDQTDWEKFSPHRPGSQRGSRKQGTKQPSNKDKLRNQYLDL